MPAQTIEPAAVVVGASCERPAARAAERRHDRRRPDLGRVAPGLLAGLALLACGGGSVGSPRDELVLVSAAASLTDVFAAMETAFESASPGTDLVVNVASSSVLREQILGGAPVDVFAPADASSWGRLERSGDLRGAPRVFARNGLRIAVPVGNPAGVSGLADFANDGHLVGLCAAQVPCGAYADRALAQAGVTPAVDTREPNVRALLAKIEAGELDAGIVYATDVGSTSAVEGVAIPSGRSLAVEYAIAILENAPNPAGAAAFMAFVLSPEGAKILDRHGFDRP